MKTVAGAVYRFRERKAFPYLNLTEGAERLGITPQRLSRLIKRLEIDVSRVGYTLLLTPTDLNRVKKAIAEGTVKRGRKKGS